MLCFKSSSRKPLSFLQAGNLVNGDSFRHSRRNLDFFVLLAGIEGSLYISQDDVHYTLGPCEFMLLMFTRATVPPRDGFLTSGATSGPETITSWWMSPA